MRKVLIILIILFIVTLGLVYTYIRTLESEHNAIYRENLEYEQYLNQKVYGTTVATVINKVVEENKKNKIPEDENGYYIENDEDSMKVYIKMVITEKTYPMEEIYMHDTTQFVEYYNLVEFECTNIEYHPKTGKISRIFFEELEF